MTIIIHIIVRSPFTPPHCLGSLAGIFFLNETPVSRNRVSFVRQDLPTTDWLAYFVYSIHCGLPRNDKWFISMLKSIETDKQSAHDQEYGCLTGHGWSVFDITHKQLWDIIHLCLAPSLEPIGPHLLRSSGWIFCMWHRFVSQDTLQVYWIDMIEHTQNRLLILRSYCSKKWLL